MLGDDDFVFVVFLSEKMKKQKTAELCRELKNSVMLSSAFDFSIKVSTELPNFFDPCI